MKLSKHVKEIRLGEGVTQKDFAIKCGLSYISILKIENGRKVGLKVFNYLASYLHENVADLRKMADEDYK